MKKITLYIFSLLCLSVFILSLNKSFMEWWADYRTDKLHLPFTRARYGDLYSGCFLSQYMDTTSSKKLTEYKTTKNNIDLFILHDSYLRSNIKKENFIGVNKLTLSDFNYEGIKIKLNPSKKNILIIESSERTTDWRFTDTMVVFPKIYVNKYKVKKNVSAKTKDNQFIKYFFNPFINQNLEFNLFDYELFRPLKEIKAELNFNWFNKIPKDVATSSDKKYLLLPETIDPNRFESSFRGMSDNNINFIVNKLNLISEHYKNLGFDEIYFSIIPNPVSIIDANRMFYNNKILRIENSYWLHAKYIDVYNVFKKSKNQVYRKDDSHWNTNGLQLWVNEVNAKFLSY